VQGIVAESGTHDVLLKKKQVPPCKAPFLPSLCSWLFAAVLEAGARTGHCCLMHIYMLVIYIDFGHG
jgi:hypothetical protein